jgi:hypothetical protein
LLPILGVFTQQREHKCTEGEEGEGGGTSFTARKRERDASYTSLKERGEPHVVTPLVFSKNMVIKRQ